MGDMLSKIPPDIRMHVEKAIAAAGPHPVVASKGFFPRLANVWTGMFRRRPLRRRHGDTVIYPNQGVPPEKLLVISRGDRARGHLANLVSLALSRGWRVAVDDGKRRTGESVSFCALNAMQLLPSTHTCLIGVSSGARAACMASVSVPMVLIPEGHDTEPDFWMDYTEAPTLIVNSMDDHGEVLEASDNPLVATVTIPRRDYCNRWTHSVALEFLESVIKM